MLCALLVATWAYSPRLPSGAVGLRRCTWPSASAVPFFDTEGRLQRGVAVPVRGSAEHDAHHHLYIPVHDGNSLLEQSGSGTWEPVLLEQESVEQYMTEDSGSVVAWLGSATDVCFSHSPSINYPQSEPVVPNDVTRPIAFPLHRRHCPFCPPVTRPIPFPTHHRHCCRGISLVRGGVLQALPPATGCSTCLSWTTPPRSVVRRRSGWRCAHALALASSTFSPTTTTRRSSAQRVGSRYGTGASASVQTAARATCACTEGASAVSRAAPASVPDSTRPSLYLSRVRVGTNKSQRPFFPYVATPFLPHRTCQKIMIVFALFS